MRIGALLQVAEYTTLTCPVAAGGLIFSIKPVAHFEYHGTVSGVHRFGEVVVGINDENIRHRTVPPLESAVDVQIVELFVVLHKSGKEKCVGQRNIQFGTDQPK